MDRIFRTLHEHHEFQNVSAGIGCYSQNGHLYWIQCFSSHATEACTQPANQTVSPVISVLPKLINIHFNEASPITFTEEQKTLAIYITCNGFSYMSSSLDPASFTWSTEILPLPLWIRAVLSD